METILIIEDEMPILVALEDALEQAGYYVLSARNGEQGLKYALEEPYDLLVLDLMLPRLNGYDILKRLRKENKYVPVIILTAKSQEVDKIKGFEYGADDYVTKPFGVKELIARIKVRLKNAQQRPSLITRYTLGSLQFDFEAMTALKYNRPLEFSVRELELLRYLLSHRGKVISREQLFQDVWGYDLEQMPVSRSLDNYILKLRQKIEKKPDEPKHLLTVHGKGYRFVD